jgi:opacity protein-like surface antigen
MRSVEAIVIWRTVRWAALGMSLMTGTLAAQPDSVEARAKAMRRGAGVHASFWDVRGLEEVSGARVDELPLFEGYFQRGLDLHLALENSVGVYRREQRLTRPSGGIGGGTVEEKVTTYLIPQFTSLKLYPVTRPEQRFEPYLLGGAGFTIGVDDRENTGSGGLLGGGEESGTSIVAGFGLKGGAGVEFRFSDAFGITAGGRYQWIRFFGELSGERTFQGFGGDLGLVYRFQYD